MHKMLKGLEEKNCNYLKKKKKKKMLFTIYYSVNIMFCA